MKLKSNYCLKMKSVYIFVKCGCAACTFSWVLSLLLKAAGALIYVRVCVCVYLYRWKSVHQPGNDPEWEKMHSH